MVCRGVTSWVDRTCWFNVGLRAMVCVEVEEMVRGEIGV